jgi:hypothetical protein
MIALSKLQQGEWYDGFYRVRDTQQGTLTLMWDGHQFLEPEGLRLIQMHDPFAVQTSSFEPNVISIGEPAS